MSLTIKEFSVSLNPDLAEYIETKVAAGSYASASDVLRDGIRALMERDDAIERWLREEVARGHADYVANPARAVPADLVWARLRGTRAGKPK